MAGRRNTTVTVVGTILEEEVTFSLAEICHASRLPAERVIEMVQEGIVEPIGEDPEDWNFRGVSLRRIRCAQRLEADLGINTPGIALALDLLDELQHLRARLRQLEV